VPRQIVAEVSYKLSAFIFRVLLFCGEGPRSRCYGRTAALRLIVQPCDKDDYFFSFFRVMEYRWNEIYREKPKYSGEKPVTVLLCPPQIPHGLTRGSNPGLRGERPATNRLSHGTATFRVLLLYPKDEGTALLRSIRNYQSTRHNISQDLNFSNTAVSTSALLSVRFVIQNSNSSFTVLRGFQHKIVDERRYKKKGCQAFLCRPLTLTQSFGRCSVVNYVVALLADNASDPRATALDYKLTHRETVSVKSFCLILRP
jgi:hypothetical protein